MYHNIEESSSDVLPVVAFSYNAHFLECDFPECIPKHVTMVKSDICNDTERRRYDVGTVEPAAETGLYDGRIDITCREPAESHHRA